MRTPLHPRTLPALLLSITVLLPGRGQETAIAAYQLRVDLVWEDAYAGDPLRLRVQLRSPRAIEEAIDEIARIERAELPPTQGTPLSVNVPPAWEGQLSLTLRRVEVGADPVVVLAPHQWTDFLRPEVGAIPEFLPRTSRAREWLVPAAAVTLTEGDYEIDASWRGTGLAPPEQLPPDGWVPAETLRFAVATPADAASEATHKSRLAFAAYMQREYYEARRLGEESLALQPGVDSRDRLQTHFIVANSALNLSDISGAADAYARITSALQPHVNDDLLRLGEDLLIAIAPRLRLLSPPGGGAPSLLELETASQQRYITYRSDDLKLWLPLSTNVAVTNWLEILDEETSSPAQRFYRSVLEPAE